jgi:hypothetical protein
LCKYDRSKCYSSYSAEYAEKQSNEGKLVSVEEHMPMQAGTTANFGSGDVCSWHLQADTQYSPFRKMQVNFTVGEGSTAKVVYYVGKSYSEILGSGEGDGIVVSDPFKSVKVGADEEIVIIV